MPVVAYDGSTLASPRYLFADHQGSIIAATNTGGTATINGFDEYGIPAVTNTGRFQYTGQIWLTELGMLHYKARVYSPTLGRFLQTDPVGYEDQFNLYAYVRNDPVNMTDPTGRQSCPDPREPCPDILLPPREARRAHADQVGRTRGTERGGQVYRNRDTGERRAVSGREAGRGTSGEFVHVLRPTSSETTELLTHAHGESDQRGVQGQAQTRENNAPSPQDQDVMHRSGAAVQTIGPHATMTIFRRDRQDYGVVDRGDPSNIPNLRHQRIIIVADPEEDE